MKTLDLENEARDFFIKHYNNASSSTKRLGTLKSQSGLNGCVRVICQATRHLGLKSIYDITKPLAIDYIEAMNQRHYAYNYLCDIRSAFERLFFIYGEKTRLCEISGFAQKRANIDKSYTFEEIITLAQHASPSTELAILVAFNAGLTAGELYTLQRTDEALPVDTLLFEGREQGRKYIVTSKGKKREIWLEDNLAQALEMRRLSIPKKNISRGMVYSSNYDIDGGQSVSHNFTLLAQKHINRSFGLEGVRYTFAQQRYQSLTQLGYLSDDIYPMLASELGYKNRHVARRFIEPWTYLRIKE